MELRQLVFFATVSRTRNFTQAAQELFVSQPGISLAIRKLETELGVDLLDRSGGKVRLTDAGKIFQERTRNILASIDDAVLQMRAAGDEKREPIHLGLPPMLGAHVLIPLLEKFVAKDSFVDLTIHELGSNQIISDMRERKLDLGLVVSDRSSAEAHGLLCSDMQEIGIVVAMSADHPLAELSSVSIHDIENEPLILMQKGARIRDITLEIYAAANVVPNLVHTFTQIESVRRLVKSGIGITLVPSTMQYILNDLACRPLEPATSLQCSLVRRKNRSTTRGLDAVTQFLDHLLMDSSFPDVLR